MHVHVEFDRHASFPDPRSRCRTGESSDRSRSKSNSLTCRRISALKSPDGFVEDRGDAGQAGGVGEDVVQNDQLALVREGHVGQGHADGEVDLFSLAAGDLVASRFSRSGPFPIPGQPNHDGEICG